MRVLVAYMAFLASRSRAAGLRDEDVKQQAHHILVTLPVMVISAAIVRYLRDTLERRERQYRGSPTRRSSLAERIRGPNGSHKGEEDLAARLERLG